MTNLKRIRSERGLTQAALADAAGISIRLVQDYEQGHKNINGASAMAVYRLAVALKCTVADLLERE